MKQILNNILNANSWLFLELVIITIVAWAVFEPAVVNYYYRSLPQGYDSEQLLYAETEVNGEVFVDENGTPHDFTRSHTAPWAIVSQPLIIVALMAIRYC